MKKITVLTGCYNEEENVEELYTRVKAQFDQLPDYTYEHLFIDNHSEDGTVAALRKLAAADRRVKVIVNTKNFGHIRSPFHGLLQCDGDAVVNIAADLQDPPELIPALVSKWEEGYQLVIGTKTTSEETGFIASARKFYYFLMDRISETEHISNFTGFGLYDRSFVDLVKGLQEPYPYLRGLISEFGLTRFEIPYHHAERHAGETKNNIYTLYDMAMTGFINHSRLPLRLSAFAGFVSAIISLFIAIMYLIYKLLYWDSFELGVAPLVIGMFFLASMQLFFIGVVGEYVGAIFVQVKNRPLVIEQERINFDDESNPS